MHRASRVSESPVDRTSGKARPAGRAEGVLALQRTAGNRAVVRTLQRAPAVKTASTPATRVAERAAGYRRGMTRAQELRRVADRLIEQELGSAPAGGLGSRRNG